MTWRDMGTVTPINLGQWMTFPVPTAFAEADVSPTYKIACTNVTPSERFRTFCWFRFLFYDPSSEALLPLPAFKVYPSDEPLVRVIEVPQTLKDAGAIVWLPQIQKRSTRRNLAGTTSEPPWGINLQEWRTAANPLPNLPPIPI
ncbi:hypothetical protein [Leptolyngbya sp. KIOST-1]|uniref:hypothetical protein n=1 Tax=Leptolyngbya sp. KIOST-1 TaxID=1229172 RepID=UPI00055AFAB9|nr:hypothetical protein [Leptolyngbya sp. KIOST-1]